MVWGTLKWNRKVCWNQSISINTLWRFNDFIHKILDSLRRHVGNLLLLLIDLINSDSLLSIHCPSDHKEGNAQPSGTQEVREWSEVIILGPPLPTSFPFLFGLHFLGRLCVCLYAVSLSHLIFISVVGNRHIIILISQKRKLRFKVYLTYPRSFWVEAVFLPLCIFSPSFSLPSPFLKYFFYWIKIL